LTCQSVEQALRALGKWVILGRGQERGQRITSARPFIVWRSISAR
jgi:hypothetical protein